VVRFALPSAIKQGTHFIIVWMSSSFWQLVRLPIIIVGQNIQAAAADKRSDDIYKDAEAVQKSPGRYRVTCWLKTRRFRTSGTAWKR
jgi:hypothetical protein